MNARLSGAGFPAVVSEQQGGLFSMSEETTPGKDFTAWSKVAQEDPDAFEAMRLAAIEDFLQTVPPENRERLRRLQWRIDQERRLAHSPMGACMRLSRLMWEQVLGEGGLRERFKELGQSMTRGDGGNRGFSGKTAEVVVLLRD